MKRSVVAIAFVFAVVQPGVASAQKRLCPEPWKGSASGSDCAMTRFKLGANLRNGYLQENPAKPFRGNVVFLEGLGDSMLNHLPLFKRLTDEGYRVIAFDYLGQGGSGGSMNDTRIPDIWKIGNTVYSKYARDPARAPKILLGWSTGGLAAYDAALAGQADAIVQIAPGNAPNVIVGENNVRKLKVDRITLPTLTTCAGKFAAGKDPHVDPIRPGSPLDAPQFAANLQYTAFKDSYLRGGVDRSIRGLILLSGSEDTYVNAERTRKIRDKKAPHFQVIQYAGALHEIDNECPAIADQARDDIVAFVKTVSKRRVDVPAPAAADGTVFVRPGTSPVDAKPLDPGFFESR